MKDELAVAIVGARFGVRGEVKLRSLSEEVEHLLKLETVTLCKGSVRKTHRISSARRHSSDVLVRFEGVETPEDARLLTGYEVRVPREQAAPLGQGEYYITDLIGLQVMLGGESVGTVKSLWNSGAHDMIDVEKLDGSIVVVPFIERYIGRVDLEANSIEVIVDWILE
ncbi:MAG: 16S rRNA processing protein RimM [Spirochaetaceae bacterium]|nr:MAG: 16S rRNA processing protein RimM [Spirochaetaceae bacterium]